MALAHTDYTCPTDPTPLIGASLKLFSSHSATKFRLLRQTRHVREARRPTTRAPAHEALLRFPMQGLRADVARLPLATSAHASAATATASAYLLFALYRSAPPAFYFLAELVRPSFQCCTWHSGPQ